MKFKLLNRKAAALEIIVLIFVACAVALIVIPYLIGSFKTGPSIINGGEDIIDDALGEVQMPDLPSPDVPIETTPNPSLPNTPAATTSLSGSNLAEKAIAASKEAGLAKDEAALILKLISQESQFRHCCKEAGKNTAGTCKATEETTCEEDRVLISFDKSSTGAMQLNKNVHKPWFTTDETELCKSSVYRSVCKIKENAGCMGKTAYDVDCNIRMGIGLLKAYKNQYGGGKSYVCTTTNGVSVDEFYTGWNAALRAYVGWGCDNYHYNYVSQVIARNSIVAKYQKELDAAYG